MRKAPIMTIAEFKRKIKDIYDYIPTYMTHKATIDLHGDIIFGMDYHTKLGYRTLANKIPVLLCSSNGENEAPVHFLIYWDGKEIRGYIPEKGNTYNTEYRTAYGSEEQSQLYEERYGSLPFLERPVFDSDVLVVVDEKAMLEEACLRITVKQ